MEILNCHFSEHHPYPSEKQSSWLSGLRLDLCLVPFTLLLALATVETWVGSNGDWLFLQVSHYRWRNEVRGRTLEFRFKEYQIELGLRITFPLRPLVSRSNRVNCFVFNDNSHKTDFNYSEVKNERNINGPQKDRSIIIIYVYKDKKE